MAGLLLYGIVGWPGPASCRVQGLGGSPVRFLPQQELAAVVSGSPPAPWPVDEEHLTHHEAVVEELMRSQPILPVRFNTFLRTAEEARHLLQERAQEFRVSLERVAGRVEMGLRVLWDPPDDPVRPEGQPAPTGGPGTEYLRRRVREAQGRAAQRRAGVALIQSLHATFQPLAAACQLHPFPSDRFLLAAAYLVEQERIGAFREQAAKKLGESPSVGLLLTGPWPPYSFANGVEYGIADRLRL